VKSKGGRAPPTKKARGRGNVVRPERPARTHEENKPVDFETGEGGPTGNISLLWGTTIAAAKFSPKESKGGVDGFGGREKVQTRYDGQSPKIQVATLPEKPNDRVKGVNWKGDGHNEAITALKNKKKKGKRKKKTKQQKQKEVWDEYVEQMGRRRKARLLERKHDN